MKVHEVRDLAPCECEALRRERDEARAALTMETRVALDFQSQRDEAQAALDALTQEVSRLRVELLETQHAIGEAWFAGGVDTPTAVRRKTAALERLAHDPR